MRISRYASLALGGLIAMGASQYSYAKSCERESFNALCTGCTMTLSWKIKRIAKSEKNRWCRFSLGSSLNAQKGFRVVDGFSLGEVKTNVSSVIISGQKLGRDRVTVLRDGIDHTGKAYTSTIHFDVEVVEGEF